MAFADHVTRYLAGREFADAAPQRVPIERTLPGFRVRRIAPALASEPWVYATLGAAQARDEDGDGAEFVVLAPHEDPVLVEMLAAFASLNAQPGTRAGVGSILALGRPWTGASLADHVLVLPPYPFQPGFELYEEEGEQRTVVLWLVPITAAEAQFVRDQGHAALEQVFELRGPNLADPARPSLI